ncbi:MAG: endonuclease III [Desulfurococcales archaeon]|nr:endonuclease III [Desulfurococcales archaeon]
MYKGTWASMKGDEVYRILESSLVDDWREYVALVAKRRSRSPFSVLVGVVLSQNTNDKNSIRAFNELASRVGVDIDDILKADIRDIEESIRIAGMWRQKARTIVKLARHIKDLGGEDFLVKEKPDIVREKLLEVKGVGPKTVDVFLSVVRKAPYFAVDTHAARIARRWGLVGEKASYDEISKALLRFFGPERAEKAHRLLIALGRRYCTSKNPRCDKCPLRDICPYARAHLQ